MSSFPPLLGSQSLHLAGIDVSEQMSAIHEPPSPGQNDLNAEVPGLSLSDPRTSRPTVSPRRGQVEFAGDRAALVSALRRGDEGAAAALFHEYASLVERTIGRILGVDDDLPDATQDVFLRALRSVHKLRDPQALTDWLLQITVCTATDWVRKRKRKRWLLFFDPRELEHPRGQDVDELGREALRATYAVLDRLSVEERTVFALRYIDGMELLQLAQACDCSLATVKRRLNRANSRFEALAKHEPALQPWLQGQRTQSELAEEEPS
jgi:RNA polymerase sigma-70 factor (ECF subfamily)